MKFIKKPVVIDAVQWTGVNDGEITSFIGYDVCVGPGEAIAIRTLEGTMFACIGDWIIRGIKGEYYPCKPDIFDATYEMVTSMVITSYQNQIYYVKYEK